MIHLKLSSLRSLNALIAPDWSAVHQVFVNPRCIFPYCMYFPYLNNTHVMRFHVVVNKVLVDMFCELAAHHIVQCNVDVVRSGVQNLDKRGEKKCFKLTVPIVLIPCVIATLRRR
jgi:hypothetical protein